MDIDRWLESLEVRRLDGQITSSVISKLVWSVICCVRLTFCWSKWSMWSSHSRSPTFSECDSVVCKHNRNYPWLRVKGSKCGKRKPVTGQRIFFKAWILNKWKKNLFFKDKLILFAGETVKDSWCFFRWSLWLDLNSGLAESPPWGQNYSITAARTLRRLSRGYWAC